MADYIQVQSTIFTVGEGWMFKTLHREPLIVKFLPLPEAAEALQKATESQDTASPTKASPSGAVAEYMRRETQASSPSVPTTTESGPAEQNSGCAHEWVNQGTFILCEPNLDIPWTVQLRCHKCLVYKFFAVTPVPAATTTPWTYPKPDSENSAEPSGITAPSLSKESGERQDLRKRCAALGHPFSRCYCGDVGVGSSTL